MCVCSGENRTAMYTKTCLIIDDDLKFAAFVQRVAESIGLQAQVLTDPTHLEGLLAAGKPDVITLDMDMPHRHGLDVLKGLSAWGLDQRVIIISGTPPGFDSKTMKVGNSSVSAVLTKPVRKQEIEAAISSILWPLDTCRPPHDAS